MVWTVLVLLALLPAMGMADTKVRVYAAASLTQVMDELGRHWEQQGQPDPLRVYAASSTLAKQIEAGAPADLFASADVGWMDHLQRAGRLREHSRIDLLGNRLVLIAPLGSGVELDMQAGPAVVAAVEGRWCTGEPGVVPVGIYAQQALTHLGWWETVKTRLVGTEDVRAALAFVERGECALGIVYATDAASSRRVRVVQTFPENSHQLIVYPFALLADSRPQAEAFLRFLRSQAAREIFQRYGFSVLAD